MHRCIKCAPASISEGFDARKLVWSGGGLQPTMYLFACLADDVGLAAVWRAQDAVVCVAGQVGTRLQQACHLARYI